MNETATATRSAITLSGSAQLVAEYFECGVASILYQRGIYPPSHFQRVSKYGTSVHLLADKKLSAFVKPLIEQVEQWMSEGKLRRLVLVITDAKTREVLERWQFDVAAEGGEGKEKENRPAPAAGRTSTKSEAKIRKEIGDVIRQITASVTFLPLLEHACSFDCLIYTGKETEEPIGWAETGPAHILNAASVDLRSFSTGLHNVATKVLYKNDDPDE